MSDSLKKQLAAIDILSMTADAVIDRLAPKQSDYENMDPGEREAHERAMGLSELDSAFERLGMDKKLEALKPDLDLCRRIIGKDVHFVDERVVFSIKRIIEFIECLDEP